MFAISKAADLNWLVQGGQLYCATFVALTSYNKNHARDLKNKPAAKL
jgi:hypothetical protein